MFPGVVEVKDTNVLKGLMDHPAHPILTHIILWIAAAYGLVITESYRKQRHPNDLHGVIPVRAYDLRAWCYNGGYARARLIEQKINEEWIYDPDRPDMKVALLHDSGQGIHFHIQVHPLTRKR